jgi:hypothetical protein
MKFTRDSAIWWFGIAAGVAGAVATLDTKTAVESFGIPANWLPYIRLTSFLLGTISGLMRMSPRPLSEENPLATQPADARRTLSITGKASAVLLAIVIGSSIAACAPKQFHAAVIADQSYSQAVFALQDAEMASHQAQLISDAKHQDYKKIVAKLLRAGDAVTIALQHWQPGTPMPQVVADAWRDASALLADVKAILPGSDPFIQKIQDLLSLLQKFGVIPTAFAVKPSCVQLSCVLCEVNCG